MAEPENRARLLPSLLERLTDDEPFLSAEMAMHERVLAERLAPTQLYAVRECLAEERRHPLDDETAEALGLGEAGADMLAHVNALIALDQQRRFERRAERTYSVDRVRDAIVRDLDWLLNSENLATLGVDWDDDVATSVMNYGIAPLMGRTLADLRADQGQLVAAEIARAIRCFEPRLDAERLEVHVVEENAPDPRAVHLRIEAEIKLEPAPVRLLIDTVLDTEEQKFTLRGIV